MDLRGFGLSEEDLAALGYDVEGRDVQGEPASVPTPRRREDSPLRVLALTLFLLALMGWAATSYRRLPSPVPANRADTVFSSGRAMSQLVEIARKPRPPGSPEHERVLAYLTERFRSLGLSPQVRTSNTIRREDGTAQSVNTRNLLIRIHGAAPTGTILLTAHYDSPPLSPGAGDDGIGVASMLEVARVLAAGEPLRNDVLILLADGGALGRAGARAFAAVSSDLEGLKLVISAEMRGVKGPVIASERLRPNQALVHVMDHVHTPLHTTSLLRHLPPSRLLATGPDPWAGTGLPLIRLTGIGGPGHHEQETDRAEAVSERTLQHMGSQILELTRQFGSMDLSQDRLEDAGTDLAYFTLPWLGLVHHPADWGFFLSLGLLGAWILLATLARLRGASYRGILAGLLLGILLLAGAAALGWSLAAGLRGLHPEHGIVESAFFRDDIHFLLLLALVVALGTGAYGLARRWFSMEELGPGALAVPLALAAWWGIRVPLAAAPLQWSVALSVLSTGLFFGLRARDGLRGWVWAGALLFVGGVMAILEPHLEVLAGLMTFRGAAWVGAAFALAFVLILPVVEWLLIPWRWFVPALALVVGGGLFLASLPSVQGAEDHPTLTSLVYLVDGVAGSGSGQDLPGGESPPPAPRRVRGQWLTIPRPDDEWARSWVVEGATGDPDPGDLMLPGPWGFEILGTGPEAHVALPSAWIVRDSVAPRPGRIQVAIQPRLGGEMVGVRLLGERTEITGMNGRDWDTGSGPDPVRRLVHWGPLRDGTLSLELRLPAGGDTIRFEILEHHLRPEEVLGGDFFSRDPSQIANAPAGSDRIVQRTRVSIPLATTGGS